MMVGFTEEKATRHGKPLMRDNRGKKAPVDQGVADGWVGLVELEIVTRCQ